MRYFLTLTQVDVVELVAGFVLVTIFVVADRYKRRHENVGMPRLISMDHDLGGRSARTAMPIETTMAVTRTQLSITHRCIWAAISLSGWPPP